MPDSSRKDPRPWGFPRPRLTLARRLTATFAAMALLSTALAVFVQDRTLSRDLRRAAEARLERAARATELLVASHLRSLEERYRAVSGTPQLRATLELADAPTLTFFAQQLREQQGAELIAFRHAAGARGVQSGDARLAAVALAQPAPALFAEGGALYAVTAVPLLSAERSVGDLVAVERVGPALLARWSELCGASVVLGRQRGSSEELARAVGAGELSVVANLAAERAALAAARAKLALAGAVALAITLVGCAALARSLVQPIRRIQGAVDGVRAGNLGVRLGSERGDEIGDVARGIDLMVDTIRSSHDEINARVAELKRSREHLATAQQLARVGSFEFDALKDQIVGTSEFWSVLGFRDPIQGATQQQMFERVHPEDRASAEEALRACLEGGVSAHLDHRIRLDDGTERFCHTQFQLVERDGTGRIEGTIQDITDRRRADEQIRFLAYHDGLTGLGNRRLFAERMELAISQARRRGTRLGVLFLDLDHFKRINDTLGHSVGDDLLRGVADRVITSVRGSDLVARGGEQHRFDAAVSRLGGDEFIALLPNVQDPHDLASVAQRIQRSLQRPFRLRGHELVIGASIGVAIWPEDGESVDALLSNADSAMYHAKSQGRNGYQFYDQSMNATALRRLQLESRLRLALEQGGLGLRYQPKLELATGRITGLEALARWTDAELGSVSPVDFIPVAEQTGLIGALGRWVLHTTCLQILAFERELGASDLCVSFNISASEFHPGIAQEILAGIEAAGVNPVRLQAEITESLILRDEESVIAALMDLRASGVSIALDDFGTGYSSLSYLRRLPVDTLKIDRSFVAPIARSRDAAALTRSIVGMGKALGLRVVAEGVETQEQRALLADWACDEIQGFVIAPALPPEEALALLRANRGRR
ncbi:MAG TPA: EAL domain-containing protein [Myxococcota bacterium]